MPLPSPREQDTFSEAVNAIQKARPTPLSIFRDDNGEDAGRRFKDLHDVEVLNLSFDRDKITWRNLHNNPNIEIVSEAERTSRISTLTYIKFIRRVPVDEPDPEPDSFQEPCEEDDPLFDELWGD